MSFTSEPHLLLLSKPQNDGKAVEQGYEVLHDDHWSYGSAQVTFRTAPALALCAQVLVCVHAHVRRLLGWRVSVSVTSKRQSKSDVSERQRW